MKKPAGDVRASPAGFLSQFKGLQIFRHKQIA